MELLRPGLDSGAVCPAVAIAAPLIKWTSVGVRLAPVWRQLEALDGRTGGRAVEGTYGLAGRRVTCN